MERFLRVKSDDGVTYYNVERIVSIEIKHESRQAAIRHDGTNEPAIVKGESYEDLIAFLGHEV